MDASACDPMHDSHDPAIPAIRDAAFQDCPDRRGTGSEKWDRWPGSDVLPLWVADMDFRASAPVLDAIRQRIDHGVFGYTHAPPGFAPALVEHAGAVGLPVTAHRIPGVGHFYPASTALAAAAASDAPATVEQAIEAFLASTLQRARA